MKQIKQNTPKNLFEFSQKRPQKPNLYCQSLQSTIIPTITIQIRNTYPLRQPLLSAQRVLYGDFWNYEKAIRRAKTQYLNLKSITNHSLKRQEMKPTQNLIFYRVSLGSTKPTSFKSVVDSKPWSQTIQKKIRIFTLKKFGTLTSKLLLI